MSGNILVPQTEPLHPGQTHRLVGEMEAFTIQGDEYIKVDAKPGRLPGRNVIRAIIKSLVG